MEWKQFQEKYNYLNEQFNQQPYNERVRVSTLMYHEAIRELIRSKKNLVEAIGKIDERIKQLEENIKENEKIIHQQ